MKPERNTTARDSLVYQITEAMDDLKQKNDDIQAAMNYMEQARNSCYTNPMDEVRTILKIAHDRLNFDIDIYKQKALNLAGVADEIYKSEMEREL